MIDVIVPIVEKFGFPIAVAILCIWGFIRKDKELAKAQEARIEDSKQVASTLSDHKELIIKLNLLFDKIMKNGNGKAK